MAVAPPLDLLIQKAPTAFSLLETQLFKVTKKLSEKVSAASAECDKMPKGISCTDPSVIHVKQILEQIQTIIQKIADILRIVNIVYGITLAVAYAAYAYIGYQLTLPVPAIPSLMELIEAQKQLAANIIQGLKTLGVVIGVVNGLVQMSLAGLAGVINTISSICQDEVFVVFSATQNEIDFTSIANIDLSRFDVPPSKFYQTVNVSDEDVKSRADAAEILINQQRSLLDLLEAPSKVITFKGPISAPGNIGKAGDYAINTDLQMIYGPKPSDTTWNEGVKY